MHSNHYINKLSQRLNKEADEDAHAAVAVLVRPLEDDIEFFLVKRAVVERDPWSGDMAFPGGKRCEDDENLNETAERETIEETAIDLENVPILGYLEPVYSSIRTDMLVQPIVYLYTSDPDVKLNYELTRYIWAAMKTLKESKTEQAVKGWHGTIYKAKGEIVWGLTFKMLEKIITLID